MRQPARRCPRCGGATFRDQDNDLGCYTCGWRDYHVAQQAALAEEAARAVESEGWIDDGYTGTRASRRVSRRRNR